MTNQSVERNTHEVNNDVEQYMLQARSHVARTAKLRSRSGMKRIALSAMVLALGLGIGGAAPPANAAVLNSTVLVPLALPQPCPGSRCGLTTQPVTIFGATEPTLTVGTSTFSGIWSSPVASGWQGTFTGTGPYPDGAIGQSSWDFTTLHAGNLPAGTYLNFGDLDHGSGTDERFLLQALDSNHNPIQSAWLSGASYCTYAPNTPCDQPSMPEYAWGGSGGTTGANNTAVPAFTYEFDGYNVAGNPTTTIWFNTNTRISYLVVDEYSTFDGMGLAAPAPEPGTLALLGSGVLGLSGFLRRRLRG